MRKPLSLVIATVLCLVLSNFVSDAAESKKIAITQTNLKSDVLSVYFDALDAGGAITNATEGAGIAGILGDKGLALTSFKDFGSSGEAAAYIYLVDISKSIDKNLSVKVKQVLNGLIEKKAKDDKVAVVTFGNDVVVKQDFTADAAVLKNQVNGIEIKDDNTNLYRGVVKAIDMFSSANGADLPGKRVVIVVSDGEESDDKGITKDEVFLKIKDNRIPVYSVGFYSPTSSDKAKEYMKTLGSFARTSNGQDFVLGMSTSEEIIRGIQNRIVKGYVATFDCSNVKKDGQSHFLKISLEQKNKSVLEDGLNIRMDARAVSTKAPMASPTSESVPDESDSGSRHIWESPYIYIGAIIFILIVIAIIVTVSRRRKKSEAVVAVDDSIPDDETSDGKGDENHNMDFGNTVFEENKDNTGRTTPLPSEPMAEPDKKGVILRFTKLGRNNEEKPYEVNLKDGIIIGRDPSKAKLAFKQDEKLSGRHCEIILKDAMVFIVDLKSTNGTYVNGVPIDGYYRLNDDDIILIGSMELRVNILKQ